MNLNWSFNFRKYRLVAAIAVMVLILDLVFKFWIQNALSLHQEIEVISGFFNINYVRNLGAAFGLMSGWGSQLRKVFFLVTTSSAVLVMLYLLKRNRPSQKIDNIALSLILGGALGNAVNRAYLGYVIDFLHFHWREQYHFPSFNFADVATCLGVGTILHHQFISERSGSFATR